MEGLQIVKDLWPLGLLALLVFAGGNTEAKADGKERSGGRYWSTDGDTPSFDGFDFGGNGLFIDAECGAVAEGKYFFPFDWDVGVHRAEEAPSLPATLAIGSDNTAMGFIDYLVDREGVSDPLLVAARMLEEVSPQCASVPDTDWGNAMRAWYTSLVDRVSAYMTQDTIG